MNQAAVVHQSIANVLEVMVLSIDNTSTQGKKMTTLVKKSFDHPDELKTPDKVHAATIKFNGASISKLTLQPGWKWSEIMKPLVGGHSCQAPHVGTLIKGVLHVVSDDGSEITVHAGDAYVFAPGHDAWVVGNEEVIAYEFNTEAKDFAVWKNYKA